MTLVPDYEDVFSCAFTFSFQHPAATLGVTPELAEYNSVIRIPELDKSVVSGGTYTYTVRVDDSRDGLSA